MCSTGKFIKSKCIINSINNIIMSNTVMLSGWYSMYIITPLFLKGGGGVTTTSSPTVSFCASHNFNGIIWSCFIHFVWQRKGPPSFKKRDVATLTTITTTTKTNKNEITVCIQCRAIFGMKRGYGGKKEEVNVAKSKNMKSWYFLVNREGFSKSFCFQSFSSPAALTWHVLDAHEDEQEIFSCDVCTTTFSNGQDVSFYL